ncbi:acyl-CoA dehydrogenase family protein [Micromonospora sp. NPDC051925]|uniref:acyl-CoA dehydrogenase family protein n=1 Tax=Micromonospora sp. NPDC051925 TaxID=3364288 RepID=UPI0037C99012
MAEADRVLDACGSEVGLREQYERLGRAGLLAVHYPVEYGGRGLTLGDHCAVSERLGLRGLPDVAHLITVQGVGCTVLAFGNDRQRASWLPDIAAGRLLASLLLSEIGAGSDLTGITTSAVPDGDGWRITGQKSWSMWTDWSDVALCSVRTRRGGHRYDGISLFVVDLRAPGVHITPIARTAGEPYYTVTFDDVGVEQDALLGPLHEGWALLPTAIGFERGGLDYLSRAQRWLAATGEQLDLLADERRRDLAAGYVEREFLVENARMLAYHAADTADGLRTDETVTAYAKLAAGLAAQSVARWAGEELLPVCGYSQQSALLDAAVAEAPELTVSGGAQELQLDLIANDPMIGGVIR